MKNWYLLLLSLMAALALFMALSLFYRRNTAENLNLAKPVEIVLKSTKGQAMDFWDVVNQGIKDSAKEFGVKYEISGPKYEKEIDQQISILNVVIDKKPPLIILVASDYVRLSPLIEKANRLGIPVITFDSGVDSALPVSFIATDNTEAGVKAGKEMKRLIMDRPHKSIAIVSHIQETATAIERENGVRQALRGENVIGTWFCDVLEDKAYQITLELLRNGDVGGIVALNEVSSLGVARAIDETGKKDDVLVVGFDNAKRELNFLEEGVIKATVVQRPYNMGYLTIKTAFEFLKGRKVEPFIDTGSVLITRDNMFKREYQELLFPIDDQNQ